MGQRPPLLERDRRAEEHARRDCVYGRSPVAIIHSEIAIAGLQNYGWLYPIAQDPPDLIIEQ